MVSKYLKALALTLVILAVRLFTINYLDEMRANNLANTVEESALELQASQQLFLYESIFPEENICGVLLKRIELQKTNAAKVLGELETARKNSLFPDSGLLKKKFILQNLDLYLLIAKAEKECALREVKPVLYFYPDKYYCAECASQALVLDSVVSKCSNVRVFAFPTDLDIPLIDVLAQKYGVEKYPTLVFSGVKRDYLVSEIVLKDALGCKAP